MGVQVVYNNNTNLNVGVSMMEEYEEDVMLSDSELVLHIRDVLRSVSQGAQEDYNELIAVMHHTQHLSPDHVGKLEASLKGLSGAVSCINIDHHKALLASIFRMSLWKYQPNVMDALVELIISLAVSNGKYIDLCLEMLVQNFTPPRYFIPRLKEPRGLTTKHEVLSRVHSAIKEIAHLVPLSPLVLADKIVQKLHFFSPRKDSVTEIVIYVENMLKLENGAIGELMGTTMLLAIMDKLIDLDVEIPWDEHSHEDPNKCMFEMELDDEEDDEEVSGLSLSRKSLDANSTAEALDTLMVLVFEHLESCSTGGRLAQVFDILLQSFEKTVLSTYRSKYAQFVMFYACALDPENCGQKFTNILLNLFFSSAIPQTRISAFAYLASYMSRAVFLPDSFVLITLERLVDWGLEYCGSLGSHLDPTVHRVFYSACQAVMYVLCFRMRTIMANLRLKSQLVLMPLEPIFLHQLNPLKVCLPDVVKEFLKQAKRFGLFTLSETFIFDDQLESELSKAYGGLERLDMFFPFDPCMLKRSDGYIKPNYKYWSMVKAHEDDWSEDEDEDEEDDDAIVDWGHIAENGAGKSFEDQPFDLDEFGQTLDKMSITPKNSMMYRFGGGVIEPGRMPSILRPSMSPRGSL